MIKRWIGSLIVCMCLPLQSFADITGTTLIPNVGYDAYDYGIPSVPPGAYYFTNIIGGAPVTNPTGIHFSAPRPAHIDANNSRHTVAMDVLMLGNTDQALGHLILATRHSGQGYQSAPDNRAGAIIIGNVPRVWSGLDYEVFGSNVEEIEITSTPPYGNVHHAGNLMQRNQWYRISVETITQPWGGVALEARVWTLATDPVTGARTTSLIHSTGTIWSSYPSSYNPANAIVSVGAVLMQPSGRYHFANLSSYWSHGGEWVPNP